MDAADKI